MKDLKTKSEIEQFIKTGCKAFIERNEIKKWQGAEQAAFNAFVIGEMLELSKEQRLAIYALLSGFNALVNSSQMLQVLTKKWELLDKPDERPGGYQV